MIFQSGPKRLTLAFSCTANMAGVTNMESQLKAYKQNEQNETLADTGAKGDLITHEDVHEFTSFHSVLVI